MKFLDGIHYEFFINDTVLQLCWLYRYLFNLFISSRCLLQDLEIKYI